MTSTAEDKTLESATMTSSISSSPDGIESLLTAASSCVDLQPSLEVKSDSGRSSEVTVSSDTTEEPVCQRIDSILDYLGQFGR